MQSKPQALKLYIASDLKSTTPSRHVFGAVGTPRGTGSVRMFVPNAQPHAAAIQFGAGSQAPY